MVAFEATACSHCGAALPPARFDYYNYTDFEPDVEAGEDRLVRRAMLFLVVFLVGIALCLLYLIQRCRP